MTNNTTPSASTSDRFAGDIDVSPVVGYKDSVALLQSSKNSRNKAKKQRNISRDNFTTQYGNFNLAQENGQRDAAKANLESFQGGRQDFLNRKQSGENKYKSWNEYKTTRKDARKSFQTEQNDVRGYQSALKQKKSDQKAFSNATNNFKNTQDEHTARWGNSDANFAQEKNHSHSTWQDALAGERTYSAFNADTANTSYGISKGDYNYETNMGDDDYRTKFNSDADRIAAVKEAVKNYGGTLPYGGKEEDYEISGNGMLMPKGQNYSYADKSMVGQDGYKSDVATWKTSRNGGYGSNRYTTHTTNSTTLQAKKWNEENDAMKNFRSVHGQNTWDNVQKYNTQSNKGGISGATDFSDIGRYQNSFYNRDVTAGPATNQVNSRTDLSPAERGGDTWEDDDKDSTYWKSSSYSTYRPSSSYSTYRPSSGRW
jgi:hypothetical protein